MRFLKRKQSPAKEFPLDTDWEKLESQAELLPTVESLQGLTNDEIKSFVNNHLRMASFLDRWRMFRAIKREQKNSE
ncbi:MAG: hypothetical protein RL414_530 [Actinomycetota bacterium]|jgi:hypothetical protein